MKIHRLDGIVLNISPSYDFDDLKIEDHFTFSKDFIERGRDEAMKKVNQKYPNFSDGKYYSVSLSKRESENSITASYRFCLGDGDYVSRVVYLPFPDVKFA